MANVTLHTTLELDVEAFQRQRAAVLAVLETTPRPVVRDALEGLLNPLDHLSDEIVDAGLVSEPTKDRWWSQGCETVGIGPVDPDA